MKTKVFSIFLNHLKMNLLKSIVFFFILAGGFTSCSKEKEDEDFIIAYDASLIVGRWKIEKVMAGFGHETNYSKLNIIYEFHPNGFLSVTGEADIFFDGYRPGEYPYSFIDEEPGGCNAFLSEKNIFLKINTLQHPPTKEYYLYVPLVCTKKMILFHAEYCDPPTFFLKKITK